ncbi:MAG TPA: leucine-rich repeat domain-containing protein [Pirellulales bacterium]
MAEATSPTDTASMPTRRWFTPATLLYLLLIAQATLMLSQRYRWFAFNEHPGWAMLICIISVATAIVVLLAWLIAARLFRWRFQFSLLSLFLVVLAVGIVCGWLLRELDRAHNQAELLANSQTGGYSLLFEDNFTPNGGLQFFSGSLPGPTWLEKIFGREFFREVVGASVKTDAALERLKDQTSLRRLYANDSSLTDAGLKPLANFKRLEWLDLRDSPGITDAGMQNAAGLTHLQGLLLTRLNIGDAGLANFKDCKHLDNVDLGMTHVTGAGLASLANSIDMRTLNCWANPIDDAGFAHLKSMIHMRGLCVGFASITDAGLETVAGMNQLETLNIRGSKITDAGLKTLAKLQHLQELDLYNTQITDAGLEQLAALTELNTLRLGNTRTTPDGIKKLQQALPKCKLEL